MNTPTLHSLLRWCWTRRFPVLFTAVVTGLLMPSFSASPPGNSRKVIDLRTGKTVENVLADGTIYQFQATVPKVNLWQVPLPLEGVWIESADKSTLTWISSHSGGSGDSTDCGGAAGGAAGDCPTNNPSCGGVPYDPVTEGCCDGQIYDLATEDCCDGVVFDTASQGCCGGQVYDLSAGPCGPGCDTTDPMITCDTGRKFCVGDTILGPTGTDNCGTPTTSPASTNFTSCGTYSVLWTATDGDANTNSCTESLTVVGVASLTPDEGIDIGGRTNIVCWETNGHVTVTAVSCPELTAEQLPACWVYTGGEEVDKLTHRLAKDTPSAPVEFKVTAGTSTTNLWVAVVKVDIEFMGEPDDRVSLPPNEVSPGAFLCQNNNDDNANGFPDNEDLGPTDWDDPDLQPVTLTVDPNLQRGTVTLEVPSHLRAYSDQKKNPTVLEWNLAETNITPVYIEAYSPGAGALKLTWTLDSATCSDFVNVLVLEVDASMTDIVTGQVLTNAMEEVPGAIIPLNDNDDDNNNQSDLQDSTTLPAGDDDLKVVNLTLLPSPSTNDVEIVVPSGAPFKVWADKKKTPLPNPPKWDLSVTNYPSSFYVEGVAIGEDFLTVTWDGGGGCKEDRIRINVIKPNLTQDGVVETDEENPGGTLCVNSDDDDNDEVVDKDDTDGVADGDDDLKSLTLDLQRPEGFEYGAVVLTWSSSKIGIYEDIEKLTAVVTNSVFAVTNLPQTVYIEGVQASASLRDEALTLTYTNLPTCRDVISNTVFEVDLDIDSDNDNGLSDPARSADEDLIEAVVNDATKPGKFIAVNDGDVDGDGVPDFADGFDKFGNEGANASTNFVPIILEVKTPIDLQTATIKFSYSASDPDQITRTGNETDGYVYVPAVGHLRVWTKDGAENRNKAQINEEGDFVASGEEYQLSELPSPFSTRTWRFYVEGIDPSSAVADQSIEIEVDPDGEGELPPVGCEAVRVTVIRVDMDIDSNNHQSLEQSDLEDAIEDRQGEVEKPGKVVFINTGDVDGDGVADFADGFDLYENQGTNASPSFTPLVVEVPQSIDLSVAKFRVNYAASDPGDVTRTGDDPTNHVYTAATGHLRIWTKDGPQDRKKDSVSDSGHYVVPNTAYSASDLGFSNSLYEVTLFLEGINVSTNVADQQIKVELDPDGDGPAGYVSTDSVRVTLVGYRLVQPDESNNVTPVTNIKNSHPSPVVTLSTCAISNVRPGPSGTNLVADIEIEGSLASAVCDYTPGDEGKIDEVSVFINGYETPTATLDTAVTKGSGAQSFLKPFPFSATFSETLEGVEVQAGVNVIRVEAADKVFEIVGYAEMSVVIEATPAWAIGQNYTDYSVSLDFDGAQSLADITGSTPVTLTFTNHLQATNNVYQGAVYKSSSSPLTFTNAQATVVITDTNELNTALATNVVGTAQAFISIPALAPINILFALSETAVDSSVFENASVQFEMSFSGALQTNAVDTVTAKIRKSGGSWTQETLTETGDDTLVFESTNPTFVVTLAAAPDFGTNTVEGIDLTISHDTLNVNNQEVVLIETGLATQSFDHDNAIDYDDSAFGPRAWNYSVEDAEPLSASEGGEFHPYLLQILGPSELLSEIDHIETAAGNRNVVQGFDGNSYISMANNAIPAIVVSNPGSQEPDSFVSDLLGCPLNFVKGFYAGASDLKEGVATIVEFLVKESLRLAPPLGPMWVMNFGDQYKPERVFIGHAWDTVKALDETLTALQTALQQDEEELIAAALAGDWEQVNAITEPYRLGVEYSVELLDEFWTALDGLSTEEYCYWTGRAGFEIVTLAVSYTKAANATKLGFLNELKTKPLYSATIGGSTRFKTALDNTISALQRLSTTKMCFVPGTKIHTDQGLKNIEDIQKGNWVLARDAFSGQQAYKPATETIVTHPSRLYHLTYRPRAAHRVGSTPSESSESPDEDSNSDGDDDSETLLCTGEHPFFVASKGIFVPADALSIGDFFLLANDRHAEIISITTEDAPAGQTFTTYNLAVEDYHTYFVGEHGVWVHNTADRACARILSVYLRKVKKQGANPHPWEAFEELAEQLPNATGRALYPALGEASHDAYVLADTANDLSKAPSVIQIRALLKGREGLDVGEYVTRAGKHMPNKLHVHHTVPERLQNLLKLQGKGMGVDIDSCPGFPTTFEQHIGRDPGTIHKVIDEYLPKGSSYNLSEIKDGLQVAYTDPRIDRPDVANIVLNWLDQNYGP